MDMFDRASETEAKQTEMAIAHHLLARPNIHLSNSASECLECGDPIPKARQQSVVGCLYCTPCQTLIEQGRR
jgi:phage/conjugal plasmid C-4 type zinc finger TraR family protein